MIPNYTKSTKLRKNLCADGLIKIIYSNFEKIIDHRQNDKVKINLTDALMSGFAVFAIKSRSLLEFENNTKDQNLKNIFLINNIPSDTQMRTILDEVDPIDIKPLYKEIFRQVQRGKCLEDMEYLDGHYLISNDGTSYFSSEEVSCKNCLEKTRTKTGKTSYHHQMLASAIVHPNHREVIPLCPEPIIKQDGQEKNDCERNASKRLLKQFRKDHPYLKAIITEDALGANAPHIKDLKKYNCRFIIGIKEDGNKFLFNQINELSSKQDKVTEIVYEEKITKAGRGKTLRDVVTIYKIRFTNQVPLNQSNKNILVNFIECWETKPNGKQKYGSWITDIEITEDNAFKIMRGGRARWKIENETFNTLKNQGYNFEHNYGHGKNNLSTVFALLMMLAFLVDQVQQRACRLFNDVWQKIGNKSMLWQRLRMLFYTFKFKSMQHLFEAMLYGLAEEPEIVYPNST